MARAVADVSLTHIAALRAMRPYKIKNSDNNTLLSPLTAEMLSFLHSDESEAVAQRQYH